MNQVWLAQLILLPVHTGWAMLYWWAGRDKQRRRFNVIAVLIAILSWLGVALWVGAEARSDGLMWAVIASTTAGFLVFNLVLAGAAWLRRRVGVNSTLNSALGVAVLHVLSQ